MVEKVYRIIIGCFLLLLVDFIWVASSELTEYLYHDKKYNKPFFSTYVKTSMFMIYFVGFIICKPWRVQCLSLLGKNQPLNESTSNGSLLYSVLDQTEHGTSESDFGVDINSCPEEYDEVLGQSIWVPVKFNDVSSEKSSGTESDGERNNRKTKSVRFCKMSEVRQLSDSQAEEALLARLSYQATVRARQEGGRNDRLDIHETAKLALTFSLFWFIGNLSYQLALDFAQAGVVNVLSSTSSLFTLILTCFFPSNASTDRFSLSKLIVVIVSIGSVAIISVSETSQSNSQVPVGAVWAVSGAFFYSAYIVMIRYKVSDEDAIDMPMFFGFVGFYNFIILWPSFFILNYSQLETFQWPNIEQWCIILVNGLVGTVFSELLWLWGCLLTSSLMASLSMSLTIPLTVIFDVFLKDVKYPRLFFVGGTIPLFISFFIVTFLSHRENWDPIAILLLKFVRHSVLRRPLVKMRHSLDKEQTQSLIEDSGHA